MSTWTVVLLGLIALGSLVQSIVLLGMLRDGLVAARRLRQIQESWDQQLAPALAQGARMQQDVAVLAELLARQQERLQEFTQAAAEKVESARSTVGPVAKVLAVVAVARGAAKAFRIVRKLRRRL